LHFRFLRYIFLGAKISSAAADQSEAKRGLPMNRFFRLGIVLLAPSCFFLTPLLQAQQMEQDYKQFQIDRGATLYSSNCGECHTDGTGVPGVNLRTGQFPRGSSDADIISAISNGIANTMMPPHDFSGPDLTALLAYIRSLAQDHSDPVQLGDPQRGEALFEGAGGCLNCHRVGAKGARTALNLSDTGTLHPPSFLERALLDPNSTLPLEPENRLVRAVTTGGKVINGRRLNEDTYTVQLIDEHENLVSLEKSDLRSLTILQQSPMPSLKGKFSGDQISDLVAYLASLKSSLAQSPTQFGSGPSIGSAFPGRGAAARGGANSGPSTIGPNGLGGNATPGGTR
jgi:putative heme-binding domain-containing protein